MDITNSVKFLPVFWLTQRLEGHCEPNLPKDSDWIRGNSPMDKGLRTGKEVIAFKYLEN